MPYSLAELRPRIFRLASAVNSGYPYFLRKSSGITAKASCRLIAPKTDNPPKPNSGSVGPVEEDDFSIANAPSHTKNNPRSAKGRCDFRQCAGLCCMDVF